MNPAANPFLLPGLGQAGDAASNPLLASLEMMRDAWQRMAGLGGADGGLLGAQPLSVDEMDRRIAELRAVENWLRLNLSMLTSSIQGLEVQRATLNTLKAFATNPASVAGGLGGLGAFGASARSPAPEQRRDAAPRDTTPPPRQAQDDEPAAEENDAASLAAAGAAQAAAAAQGWWDMLQQQFNSLAAATAASLQGPSAEASEADAAAPARRGARKAADAGTPRAAAGKSARKTSTRATASPRKRTRS